MHVSRSVGTWARRFRRAFPSNRWSFNEIRLQRQFLSDKATTEFVQPRQRRKKRGNDNKTGLVKQNKNCRMCNTPLGIYLCRFRTTNVVKLGRNGNSIVALISRIVVS